MATAIGAGLFSPAEHSFFQTGKLRPWGGKRISSTGYYTEIFLRFQALSSRYAQLPRNTASHDTCPSVPHTPGPRRHPEGKYFLEQGLALKGVALSHPNFRLLWVISHLSQCLLLHLLLTWKWKIPA